ncbi:hypothetical protein PsorP6_011397 [Peronosclerospora sorghi]|uniref:Uncharacterized protein n=1 Tax=Peronosclerospora sorghi TaxID=230839 RepID=A0ACC0WKQ4_9STRA|nr:hypothetical protein PsorP6_011397 [Peronosclerospora sorghi]
MSGQVEKNERLQCSHVGGQGIDKVLREQVGDEGACDDTDDELEIGTDHLTNSSVSATSFWTLQASTSESLAPVAFHVHKAHPPSACSCTLRCSCTNESNKARFLRYMLEAVATLHSPINKRLCPFRAFHFSTRSLY